MRSGVRQIMRIKLIQKKFTNQLDPHVDFVVADQVDQHVTLFIEILKFNFDFKLLLCLYCHFLFGLFICVE